MPATRVRRDARLNDVDNRGREGRLGEAPAISPAFLWSHENLGRLQLRGLHLNSEQGIFLRAVLSAQSIVSCISVPPNRAPLKKTLHDST